MASLERAVTSPALNLHETREQEFVGIQISLIKNRNQGKGNKLTCTSLMYPVNEVSR